MRNSTPKNIKIPKLYAWINKYTQEFLCISLETTPNKKVLFVYPINCFLYLIIYK